MSKLAWGGLIQCLSPINGADRIQRAEVICGPGGKWSGVVSKEAYPGQRVLVCLPDSLLPKTEQFAFMERHGHRVKMMRLKGCPSEVLILPGDYEVGVDYSVELGVKKYEKPVPAGIGGDQVAAFPSFIPKTDEQNFQVVPDMVERLLGVNYYATVKYDGTSQTVFNHQGHFGACSRNWELSSGVVWNLIGKYELADKLPEGYAVQWECIGPGIQGNPVGLKEVDLRVFSIYDIVSHEFLALDEMREMCHDLGLPVVEVCEVDSWEHKTHDEIREMARGTYPNGKPREGIVIRAVDPIRVNGELLSFKIINLDYKDA